MIHIFDQEILPNKKNFINYETFCSNILKTSEDFYPKSYDPLQHLKLEKKNCVKINNNIFDVNVFINELKKYLPVDINIFISQFENSPNGYNESMFGLFADMVQNYYSCLIDGCNIPKVRILGNEKEWNNLKNNIT